MRGESVVGLNLRGGLCNLPTFFKCLTSGDVFKPLLRDLSNAHMRCWLQIQEATKSQKNKLIYILWTFNFGTHLWDGQLGWGGVPSSV